MRRIPFGDQPERRRRQPGRHLAHAPGAHRRAAGRRADPLSERTARRGGPGAHGRHERPRPAARGPAVRRQAVPDAADQLPGAPLRAVRTRAVVGVRPGGPALGRVPQVLLRHRGPLAGGDVPAARQHAHHRCASACRSGSTTPGPARRSTGCSTVRRTTRGSRRGATYLERLGVRFEFGARATRLHLPDGRIAGVPLAAPTVRARSRPTTTSRRSRWSAWPRWPATS